MAEKTIKFMELADLLEQEFANLPAGSPATTLNELIERFRVSRGTAKRTLLELQQRGVIYSRVGSGSFVAPPQRRKLILIVFDLNRSLADSDMFNEKFLVRALIRCNQLHPQYTVAAMDFSDFLRDYELLEVLHPRLKGVVLLRTIAPYLEAVASLRKRGIACAFYGSSTYRSSLSGVDYLIYNEETIVETALRCLQSRGCRTPGFIGDLPFPVYQERRRLFCRLAAKFGFSYSSRLVLDSSIVDLSDRKMLRKYLCEVDSVVAADDQKALFLCQAATKLGFRVPEEVAIIGINNIPYLDLLFDPGLTSVTLGSENDAEQTIDLLIRRIEHDEPFQAEAEIRLVKRTSA